MKKSVSLLLVLCSALFAFSAAAQTGSRSLRVSTQNPETIETILQLSRNHGCDDGQDEDWRCETTVQSRSGDLDFSRCRGEKEQWACYEDIKESCTDRVSGRTTSRSYRSYTGVCGGLSDCW